MQTRHEWGARRTAQDRSAPIASTSNEKYVKDPSSKRLLHEQVKHGRPIIENFSIHAKASGFAIILLTADDVGSLGTVEQHAALQARARQNVVFEMGFFFGLLGQGRVCAIYDAGVEMPSDLGGILYVPYDTPSGRWRWDVAREIQAAGYDVDLNKL